MFIFQFSKTITGAIMFYEKLSGNNEIIKMSD